VRCLSREQQLRFHDGYEPRDIDLHDVAVLHRLSSRESGRGTGSGHGSDSWRSP
jgi:hypothetical protein